MVSGCGVIHSPTLATARSAPADAMRIMSRSVRMPTGRVPSTTTTEPTARSVMRDAASETSSDSVAVAAGRLITSAIVRTLASAIRPPSGSTSGRFDTTRRSADVGRVVEVEIEGRSGFAVVAGEGGKPPRDEEDAEDAGEPTAHDRELRGRGRRDAAG